MSEKMKLRAIQFNVDFRYNEVSIFNTFKKSSSYPGDLKSSEAYLFVAKSRNQLLWVLNFSQQEVDTPSQTRVLDFYDTRKWRVVGSTWNPMMLGDYAADIGVELVGFKKFEELYDEARAKKTGKKSHIRSKS